jgi:soluble lytic murein transglycosylase
MPGLDTAHGAPGRADRGRPRGRPGRRPEVARRRRFLLLVVLLLSVGAVGAGWYQLHQAMPAWYARLWYPLDYEDAIVRESARNGIDPTLVAAVIYTESGFVPDSASSQGAVGLMQMLPSTADFVATLPRRPSPPPDAIGEPAANIAYGTRYLRYLLDRHGSMPLALASYNGGESNVARWEREAAARGDVLRVPEDIPFSETRGFVTRVLEMQPIYRRAYGDRLGG